MADISSTDPAPSGPRRGLAGIAGVFAAGFAAAFFLAWLLFSPGEEPPPSPAAKTAATETRVLTAEDLTDFFRAADNQDFTAMSRLGGELFRAGSVIGNHEALLEKYAIDSFPPHQVYAIFTRIGGPKSYRVLLIMEKDTVVSFMAEETVVAAPGA